MRWVVVVGAGAVCLIGLGSCSRDPIGDSASSGASTGSITGSGPGPGPGDGGGGDGDGSGSSSGSTGEPPATDGPVTVPDPATSSAGTSGVGTTSSWSGSGVTTSGAITTAGTTSWTEPDRPPLEPDCDGVMMESTVCYTLGDINSQIVPDDNYLMAIGMDTGTACPILQLQLDEDTVLWGHSLVMQTDFAFTCDQTMVRINLTDGIVEDSLVECEAVTTEGGDLLVLRSVIDDVLLRYPGWDEFLVDASTEIIDPALVGNYTRAHVEGDELYMAWHSTTEVDVYDFGGAGMDRTIVLEGYDDWIRGIDVIGADTLVLVDREFHRLATFDAATGDSRGDVYPSREMYLMSGLVCN